MSDPIVSFDEAAMRGELRELVRRTVEDTLKVTYNLLRTFTAA